MEKIIKIKIEVTEKDADTDKTLKRVLKTYAYGSTQEDIKSIFRCFEEWVLDLLIGRLAEKSFSSRLFEEEKETK